MCKYNLISKHSSTLKYFGHKWGEEFKLVVYLSNLESSKLQPESRATSTICNVKLVRVLGDNLIIYTLHVTKILNLSSKLLTFSVNLLPFFPV